MRREKNSVWTSSAPEPRLGLVEPANNRPEPVVRRHVSCSLARTMWPTNGFGCRGSPHPFSCGTGRTEGERERGREREMGRKPCCPKEGLNRGAWTSMEDGILVSYIQKHGEGKWGSLPRRAGLCHSSLLLYLYSGNTCLSFCQLNSALMSFKISVPLSLFGLITS